MMTDGRDGLGDIHTTVSTYAMNMTTASIDHMYAASPFHPYRVLGTPV